MVSQYIRTYMYIYAVHTCIICCTYMYVHIHVHVHTVSACTVYVYSLHCIGPNSRSSTNIEPNVSTALQQSSSVANDAHKVQHTY